MSNRVLYFYIFSIIFFADTYFVLPWLQPITILNYWLVFLTLLTNSGVIDKNIIKLQIVFFLFLAYTFFIDLYHNDAQKAFSSLISWIPMPFILGIFSKKKNNFKFILFYAKWYVVYNGFFALLQVMGIYVTAGELLGKLPFLDVDFGFAEDFGNQGLRISGASYSSIGFACNLGVIFMFFYFLKIKKIIGAKERKAYLVVLIFLIIMTQTRSIIFSLIPVIYFTNIIVSKTRLKNIIKYSAGFILVIGVLLIILPSIKQAFPRLFLSIEEDGSVIHRIQANVYGVVGTFYASPIIGMPIEESLEAMDIGYSKLGLFIGGRYIDQVTQHNQPSYFFRYYGFIGFIFFILIYRGMFKIALSENKLGFNKKILFAVLIFHLLYTFTHNNKITTDIYIWIFLALQFNFKSLKPNYLIEEDEN